MIIFLLLHTALSYVIYLDTRQNFVNERHNVINQLQNIAYALTNDSFLMLDQFAELFSVTELENHSDDATIQLFATLDKHWDQWQFIWDLENAKFFDASGQQVRNWGHSLAHNPDKIIQVLSNEVPAHDINCDRNCYLTATIPIMANAEIIGAFSVSRSFADTIIEYNRATQSDIAIMVASNSSLNTQWPFTTTAITNVQTNQDLLQHVKKNYLLADFLIQRNVVNLNGKHYELSIIPANQSTERMDAPYFVLINDISKAHQALNQNLAKIWFYGIFSFIISLTITLISLYLALRRVIRLSSAIPILADKQYATFRSRIEPDQAKKRLFDELDTLNLNAYNLSLQLEELEKMVSSQIHKLINQGEALSKEKDFIQHLINMAPILILTQDKNGQILSINQAGIQEFTFQEELIINNPFERFIPKSEKQHIDILKQIRNGEITTHIKYDGFLEINPSQKRHISWIHSPINTSVNQQAKVLSLGVDISDRKLIEEQMLNLATHDHLTGINNRRKFQSELKRELATAQRNQQQFGLMYIDLDQFKIVNDSCGHHAGDKLLLEVTRRLDNVIRETDILSRIGGDEFTLIMPNTNIDGITHVATKINECIRAIEFSADKRMFKIGASIGIAMYPDHGSDAQELLTNADMAMYYAKENRRGQYHVYSPNKHFTVHLSNRVYWKEIIENALQHQQFFFQYQPIQFIPDGSISHYECLLRIKDENEAILMPGDFIRQAEESGLIGQIDRLVIKKGIQTLLKHAENDRCKLAINLSGRSFNDVNLLQFITRQLAETRVNTKNIIFEITETAAVSNFTAAQEMINSIKTMGCQIALDDFGVGFSSFYYLKHLPVDYVKIDGSFIRQLDNNKEDRIFVKAITDVCIALDKKIIAEYVENEAILNIVRDFGIEYAQGFYIGKPDDISLQLDDSNDVSPG